MTTLLLLLVEDDNNLRILLNEALEEGGYEVLLASNGSEALAALDKQGCLRGLITDVNLGEGPDGWEVARRAREHDHAIPVVYMSGASAYDWTSHGVPNSSIIAKPFAMAQIIAAVSNAINARDAKSNV